MAAQNFRSAFYGFNREDVVRYIEFLNNQHAAQLQQLQNQLQAANARPVVDTTALEATLTEDDPFDATGGFVSTLLSIARGELTLDFNQTMDMLTAQLLFGDLYHSRLCNALHAMPVTREGWFLTHSAAGLAFYAYIVPFLISTAGGAVISAVLIYSLKKSGVLQSMQEAFKR